MLRTRCRPREFLSPASTAVVVVDVIDRSVASSPPPPSSPTGASPMASNDRATLLAMLAYRNGFIDQERLVATLDLQSADPRGEVAEVLASRGGLGAETISLLEGLTDHQVQVHGGASQGLEALTTNGAAIEFLLTRRPETAIPPSLPPLDGTTTPTDCRYRSLEFHAKGGLGKVFIAIDEELKRKVALKEIQDDKADNPALRSRFVAEAEITGQLEHPGIVPVYGLGTYADGRPFYAMRFIKGESLKAAIRRYHAEPDPDASRRAVQLRGLLRRFLDVCNAIDYAHARGVLHRDLKPDNVMLGQYGETLVVDWGLARVMDAPQTDASTQFHDEESVYPSGSRDGFATVQGRMMGTVGFMSPEQAAGRHDELGPASDVYSLGAILYYILTGRPTISGGGTTNEILSKVQQGHFLAARQIVSSIPRALDAICLKALAVSPEDRYPSALALATDLERWLADEPVSAYREPLLDRVGRWSRRHRVLVSTVAASLLVGVIGLGVVLAVQNQKNLELSSKNLELAKSIQALDQQSRRAEDRERQAIDAVKKFRDAVVNEPLLKNTKDLEALRKRLLQEPLTFFRSLRQRLQADNDTRPESLVRLANAAFDLGGLTDEIGDKRNGLVALEESLKIFQSLTTQHPTVAEYQRGLADSYNNLGNLLSATGKPDDALKAHAQALDIRKTLATQHPAVAEYQRGLADSNNNLGNLLSATGKPDDALKAYEQARDIRKTLATQHPTVAEHQGRLADSYNNLGLLLSATGKSDDAFKALAQALDIRKTLATQNPTVAEHQGGLALSYNNIGGLLRDTGKADDALKAYEQALDIQKTLATQNPAVTEHQGRLALSYNNIGLLLRDTGKPDDALKAYEQALDIRKTLATQNPTVTEHQGRLADIYNDVGTLLRDTGKPDDALKAYEQALDIRKTLATQNPAVAEHQGGLALSYNNIGLLLRDTGKPDDALKALTQALDIRKTLATQNPAVTEHQGRLADSYSDVGTLLRDTGKPDDALKAHSQGLDIRKTLATQNPAVAEYQGRLALSYNNIGGLLRDTGKADDALKAYEQALDIQKTLATQNPTVTNYQIKLALSYNDIGTLLSATGKPDDALKAYEQARDIQKTLATQNPTVTNYQINLALSYTNIGGLLSATGKPDDAIKAHEQALDIQQRLVAEHPANPDNSSLLGGILNNLAIIDMGANRFSQARKRLREAIAWQKKALSIHPAHPHYRRFMRNHLMNILRTCQKIDDRKGIAEAERELKALADSDPAMMALDAKLAAILNGEERPRNTAERLPLARRAYDRSLHALATRLWGEALTADPKLAEDRQVRIPYNAACAAALAGMGQGQDNPAPGEVEKVRLRGKALGWLQWELRAWEKVLNSGRAKGKETVGQTLQHWTQDTDLAGVREPAALAKLPEAERTAWEALWKDLERLRVMAR